MKLCENRQIYDSVNSDRQIEINHLANELENIKKELVKSEDNYKMEIAKLEAIIKESNIDKAKLNKYEIDEEVRKRLEQIKSHQE